MRRVGIFMVISAAALVLLFYNSQKFDPGVNLPEVTAGKPFTRWDGIVLTVPRGGRTLLDGESIDLDSIEQRLKGAANEKESQFEELRARVPLKYREADVSFVPLLVCLDKRSTTDELLSILDILYDAGCLNICLAVRNQGRLRALSLCSWAVVAGVGGGSFGFWKETSVDLGTEFTTVIAHIDEEGSCFAGDRRSSPEYSHKVTIVHNLIPEPMDVPRGTSYEGLTKGGGPVYYRPRKSIPLFDALETLRAHEVTVDLQIGATAKNLTVQKFCATLARLEKTGIKGYAFAAPETPY